jgi:hypothetical protein
VRRVLLTCALALASFPAAADAASVKLRECVPALAPDQRSATFEARMRHEPDSHRMQVRFTLQVSEGALPGWRHVAAAGLDEWLTSGADVGRYVYSKTVRNLSAPASYRAVVRFRWLDEHGRVLARSRATSRACQQPDMRPDLAVTAIAAADGRYAVTLHNRGRGAAGPFSVAFTAGRHVLEPVTLDGLAAGERRVVELTGPDCAPGDVLTAKADSDDAVEERDESDNVSAAWCPP